MDAQALEDDFRTAGGPTFPPLRAGWDNFATPPGPGAHWPSGKVILLPLRIDAGRKLLLTLPSNWGGAGAGKIRPGPIPWWTAGWCVGARALQSGCFPPDKSNLCASEDLT